MPKATPGTLYIIVPGDTLSGIASQAYGNGRKWRIIWGANKSKLRSGNPHKIYPGERIFIPKDPDDELLKSNLKSNVPSNGDEGLTIYIDGKKIEYITARALVTCISLADTFSCTVDGDNEDYAFKPYGYQNSECFLDSEKQITGQLTSIKTQIQKDGSIRTLTGFSNTVSIIDSCSRPPYQFKNKTIYQLSSDIVSPFGINIIDKVLNTHVFKKVSIGRSEKIGAFLLKLSSQLGLLMSSDPNGNIEIINADTEQTPIEIIEKDSIITDDTALTFDGRKRHGTYVGFSRRHGKNKSSKEIDKNISRNTILNLDIDDNYEDIPTALKWKRNKSIAESIEFPLKVNSFYTRSGELYIPNKIVTLKDDRFYCGTGFNFFITSVEYIVNGDSESTVLNLVPLLAYTDKEVIEPWI